MSERKKYYSIEIFRGVAALLVVLFHYEFYLSKYLNTPLAVSRLFEGGHAGVEFFFVLSGFVIYLTHRRDIGVSAAGATFLKKRFIRIVPMYWLVISLSLIAFYFRPGWGDSKSLTLHTIIFDYLLLPTNAPLVLAPAWTLKYEAIFYGVFLAILLRPTIGFPAFVGWQMSILLANALALAGLVRLDLPYVAFAFDIHEIGFGLGMVCAWLIVARPTPTKPVAWAGLALGLSSALAALAFEAIEHRNFADLQAFPERVLISLWYTLSFATLVVSAVRLETLYNPTFRPWLITFGASSYALYLIHDPLVSVLGKVAASLKLANHVNPDAVYLIFACAAVAVAVAVHRLIERPMTATLRRLAEHSPRPAPERTAIGPT